ncbi:MAG TPA: sensor domain-containing diguanylate cyclase [Gaiellales bacterium]|nr:sensor domain-containing diguanylate cyclase [Gaiellales bacterium]
MAPANRLQVLFDLSAAMSSTLELEEVLALFTRDAAELTGATSAELSLLSQDGETVIMLTDWSGNWAVAVGEHYSEAGETYSVARFETIRRVLESGLPEQVQVSDEGAERELRESIARYGIASSLMLPLLSRGETLGLVEVIDSRERRWDEFDVEFCMALCNVVAPAIRNALLYREMREIALCDELTGLGNRRGFNERLADERARHGDLGRIALVLLDLDGLKAINDRGGHLAGDRALRTAADAIRVAVRETDAAFRLGGDELAVVLDGADATVAMAVAARIRSAVAQLSGGTLTLSAGVAVGTAVADPDLLYRHADRAQYRAKDAGGGRVELAA